VAGQTTTNYNGQGVSGDLDAVQWNLGNSNGNHDAIYVDSTSEPDPGVPPWNEDWIQTGFELGTAHNVYYSTTAAYDELYDINSYPNGIFHRYTQYGAGANEYFETFWNGLTDGNGRGLYYAYLNTSDLGSSRLMAPAGTAQEAYQEIGASSTVCPDVSEALFGTTGTPAKWNTSTELFFVSTSGTWTVWQGSSIATTTSGLQGPIYYAYYWATYQAFETYGG
jgi:hypothetical protein